MTKEQLLRAIEQMTALQDAADSLSSRANSLARMAGINLPLSAERLFSAIQQRAMRNQQGGMQGGRQGQGRGSLADMMRQLAQMGREGVERAGQQGQDPDHPDQRRARDRPGYHGPGHRGEVITDRFRQVPCAYRR